MLRAGLTGGLGGGKSTAAAMFAALGAHVIDADTLGRELMSPGESVYQAIVNSFGRGVILADGTLDRRRLAELAFCEGRLAELNGIVHPPVIAAQQEQAARIFAEDPCAVVIVESALIFEADRQGSAPGWRQRFDRLIVVTSSEERRVARYVERMMRMPGAQGRPELEADARRRIAAQIPESEKVRLADYVIRNDGSLEETRAQVEQIFAELERASRVQAQSR